MDLLRPTHEVLFAILFLACAFFIYTTVSRADVLTLTVFHPGKGTVVLVQNPRGETLLVDTGPDAEILRALGTSLPEWQRTLGLLVLTQVTPNTAGSAPDLLSRYHVTTLLRSNATGAKTLEQALAGALAEDKKTVIQYANIGERVSLGGGETLEVLWPPQTPSPLTGDGSALALKLTFGNARVLFEESLTPRMRQALERQMAGVVPPTLRISSSTPAGSYQLTQSGLASLLK